MRETSKTSNVICSRHLFSSINDRPLNYFPTACIHIYYFVKSKSKRLIDERKKKIDSLVLQIDPLNCRFKKFARYMYIHTYDRVLAENSDCVSTTFYQILAAYRRPHVFHIRKARLRRSRDIFRK